MPAFANFRALGSSPHTRGAQNQADLLRLSYGIIPAYAGSTAERGERSLPPRDHPRIRGEHCLMPISGENRLGSSPHTRGARGGLDLLALYLGIIPAYAGSTGLWHQPCSSSWDHPRIRGEHDVDEKFPQWGKGSSPHTRGALE